MWLGNFFSWKLGRTTYKWSISCHSIRKSFWVVSSSKEGPWSLDLFLEGGGEGDGGSGDVTCLCHCGTSVWKKLPPSTQEPLLSIRRSKRTSWSDGPFDKSLKIRATQLYAALAPLLTGSCAASSGYSICVPRWLPAAADSPIFNESRMNLSMSKVGHCVFWKSIKSIEQATYVKEQYAFEALLPKRCNDFFTKIKMEII